MVAALAFTGCAGEPSSLAKAVAKAAVVHTAASVTVSAIEPTAGSVSGGTVTITGANLGKVARIEIGGQQATVTKGSGNKMIVAVPAAQGFAPGAVPIAITDKTGKAISTGSKTYDYRVQTPVDKQLSYAMTYWKEYNTAEYGDLNPVGGDCANFVSQTLIARGWTMNSEWYNKDAGDDWSPSWGYVLAMDDYLRDNAAKLGLTEYSFDQRDKIKLGDIVMFDWSGDDSLDHVQIVSGVQRENSQIKILMAGHNEDSDYRDLDQTITVDHPGGSGFFWSLPR
ncbi:conserved hypothetical protein [Leifsonia xyli subsp. xyli str. CTCB07]|uniref:IPT/TIG domain-containing protein n=2 Tax=Leifsonia xyli subsp. xyli TaxID=59736 RepID=Q6AH57_LEIXX|nr:conserved hypothetical protein [Leifsonia xyli subsp. xyli str. CTCB07]